MYFARTSAFIHIREITKWRRILSLKKECLSRDLYAGISFQRKMNVWSTYKKNRGIGIKGTILLLFSVRINGHSTEETRLMGWGKYRNLIEVQKVFVRGGLFGCLQQLAGPGKILLSGEVRDQSAVRYGLDANSCFNCVGIQLDTRN